MSNDYPLVSIIIPTYNSSDYITETLTKLEKQTYPNFEIVIVNDGSKDNTSNVLREYGLTHSRLIIINKENGGVSSARNTGIRTSSPSHRLISGNVGISRPSKRCTWNG